ncbi:uncharacterized protein LOC34619460 [Cyclospora cayetanensis]|uniref:Uncharacterized protein LOC34619460 n=1 Tax=Cyclospora cayetanensis TaxID=88456 RepID=A0A6P6S2Z8_9EIME|nr:uncharacterized protein LOC34619460 [Cyclospora cayetanensis]
MALSLVLSLPCVLALLYPQGVHAELSEKAFGPLSQSSLTAQKDFPSTEASPPASFGKEHPLESTQAVPRHLGVQAPALRAQHIYRLPLSSAITYYSDQTQADSAAYPPAVFLGNDLEVYTALPAAAAATTAVAAVTTATEKLLEMPSVTPFLRIWQPSATTYIAGALPPTPFLSNMGSLASSSVPQLFSNNLIPDLNDLQRLLERGNATIITPAVLSAQDIMQALHAAVEATYITSEQANRMANELIYYRMTHPNDSWVEALDAFERTQPENPPRAAGLFGSAGASLRPHPRRLADADPPLRDLQKPLSSLRDRAKLRMALRRGSADSRRSHQSGMGSVSGGVSAASIVETDNAERPSSGVARLISVGSEMQQLLAGLVSAPSCLIQGVKVSGLPSAMDRRSTVSACQAACRASQQLAAAAAAAAAGGDDGAVEKMRVVPQPCRYISYNASTGLCYRFSALQATEKAAGFLSTVSNCPIPPSTDAAASVGGNAPESPAADILTSSQDLAEAALGVLVSPSAAAETQLLLYEAARQSQPPTKLEEAFARGRQGAVGQAFEAPPSPSGRQPFSQDDSDESSSKASAAPSPSPPQLSRLYASPSFPPNFSPMPREVSPQYPLSSSQLSTEGTASAFHQTSSPQTAQDPLSLELLPSASGALPQQTQTPARLSGGPSSNPEGTAAAVNATAHGMWLPSSPLEATLSALNLFPLLPGSLPEVSPLLPSASTPPNVPAGILEADSSRPWKPGKRSTETAQTDASASTEVTGAAATLMLTAESPASLLDPRAVVAEALRRETIEAVQAARAGDAAAASPRQSAANWASAEAVRTPRGPPPAAALPAGSANFYGRSSSIQLPSRAAFQ